MRFPWQHREDDLDRELAHHLAELTDELVRQGHSPAEAARLARLEFGNMELIKDHCRDHSPWAWLAAIRQDLHYGARQLRRTPVVTFAAVLSLALGVGANGAIFSLMNTVLWRDLPVPQAAQMRLVHWQGQGFPERYADNASGSTFRDGATQVADFFSYPAFQQMQLAAKGRAILTAYSFPELASLAYEGRPLVGHNRPVGGDFFPALALQPHLGRLLQPADDLPAAASAVVLSHRFWSRQLGANSAVIGRPLRVNDQNFTIVGVLPANFYGLIPGDAAELYTTLAKTTLVRTNARAWDLQMLARLAPGESTASLQPTLDAAFRQSWVSKSNPKPEELRWQPQLRLDDGRRGLGDLARSFRQPLYVLGALLGLVLLIACANVANLLLARANARTREMALRLSLGCTRARLIRQLLTEAAILSALGAIGSIGVAWLCEGLLSELMRTPHNPTPLPLAMDIPLFAILIGISLFTLLLFGLWPAWRSSQVDTNIALQEGSGALAGPAARQWSVGRFLVVTQMAFSLVLVCAAILFTANLRRLASQDLGFPTGNLLLFDLRPGTSGYAAEELPQFYAKLEQQLAATPGVASVGFIRFRPMNQGGWWDEFRDPASGAPLPVAMNRVSLNYLPTLGISLTQGRHFTPADNRAGAPPVAIITADLAARLTAHLPTGSSAVGLYLQPLDPNSPRVQIIGVTPPLALASLKERPYGVWMPFSHADKQATVLVRTHIEPQTAWTSITNTIAALDPQLPLIDPFTMQQQLDRLLQRERLFDKLCSAFALLALILATIGLYGLTSYNAVRRRAEIGVRLALGANRTQVIWLVLREALLLTILGACLAAPLLWFGASLVEKELTGFHALDPTTIAFSFLLLLVTALGAAWWPAWRASRIHPMAALR